MRFKDKRVLVTGGSRGIGRAISMAFAQEGAIVAMIYRSDTGAAEQCLAELPGVGHLIIKGNVAEPLSVKAMVETVLLDLGTIDVLVNNAGVHEVHPIDGSSYNFWQEEWTRTLDTNLVGPANMAFCVAQHMIQKKSGRIVFISSRGAFRGEPAQPAYGASKAGLNSLGQSLAQALAPYNIGVGVVAPGFVKTEMVSDLLAGERGKEIRAQSPFNRVAAPEEVANAVLYLADQKSIWSSGAIIDVNGASYLRS